MTDLLIKLIPVFPLLAVIANGIFGRYLWSHEWAHRLAWGSVGLSFLCTIGVFSDVLHSGTAREVVVYRWIFGGDLTINMAFLDRSAHVRHAPRRHRRRLPDSRLLRRLHAR